MRLSRAWLVALAALAASTRASLVRPGVHSAPRRLAGSSRAGAVQRLPLQLLPTHYHLSITPYFQPEGDFQKNQFQGEVAITATVNEAVAKTTQTITLHAHSTLEFGQNDVTITQYHEDPAANTNIEVTKMDRDDASETWVLHLAAAVSGDVGIHISYTGRLAEDMDGFYVSTYQAAGRTRYLAATQFEATSARKAFPCFDEPALKATFSMVIHCPDGYWALFNTDPIEAPTTTTTPTTTTAPTTTTMTTPTTTPDSVTPLRSGVARRPAAGERSPVYFATTKPMSTYLVAFVVYDEETFGGLAREATERQGPVRIWSRQDLAGQRDYAVQVAAASLEAYSRLFPDYFLHMNAKMDQVAIPDFSAGAMENWGLVTYRERAVLIDKAESTTESRRSVVTTIAHELAHQWFGDLVSPDFWNVLWLNEGFATYWSYHVDLGSITEGWQLRDQFLALEVTSALELDATPDTHAMTTDQDSMAPFDDITYSKGGTILRMFSNWLGEDVFYDRLNVYLTSHNYSSAKPADLFAALSQGDMQMQQRMAFWTSTAGYPVINVTRNGNRVQLKQGQYQLTQPSGGQDVKPWPILLSFNSGPQLTEDSVRTEWMDGSLINMVLDALPDDQPLFFNYRWTGFYRVNYDAAGWQLITQQLQADHVVVPRESRAQLLCDAFSLARSDHLDYGTALELSRYLANEQDYLPWAVVFSAFDFLDTALAPTQYYSSFKAYLQQLLSKPYSLLRFAVLPDDDHVTRLLRASVLKHACHVGDRSCLQAASDLATVALPADGMAAGRVEPDLRSTAYCMWAQEKDLWERLWQRYLETDVATEKVELLSALGCSQDNATLNWYLGSALNATLVRPQDWATVYGGVSSTPFGLQVATDFIAKSAGTLSAQPSILAKIINGLAGKVVTDDQLEQLRSLSSVPELSAVNATLQSAIATAGRQVSWCTAHVPLVGQWLESHAPLTAGTPALPGSLTLQMTVAVAVSCALALLAPAALA